MSLISSLQGLGGNAFPGGEMNPASKDVAELAKLARSGPQGFASGNAFPTNPSLANEASVLDQARGIQPVRSTPDGGNVVRELIHAVDAKRKDSAAEARKVMTGESDNIHQSMIAAQESSVAFTMLVEVRNKMMEAYQQLMRMQV